MASRLLLSDEDSYGKENECSHPERYLDLGSPGPGLPGHPPSFRAP